jgi:methylenetetrahydrofolate reductase (NADPH)
VTRITDLLASGPTLSFEFFPPKTADQAERLRRTVAELEPLQPAFVSVTYGAGGSTREQTQSVVQELNERTRLMPMPHLTCIAHRRDELRTILGAYRDQGLNNILALHGDPPRDNPDIDPGDLRWAVELVDLAREVGGFCVGVAAHPEGHPQAPDHETDRRHQAAKLAKADFAITQFFFDPADYWTLLEAVRAAGCDVPIIPGVMPVTNVGQITRMAELSGAAFPAALAGRLRAVADDPEAVRSLGVEVATELCNDLLGGGAPGIHFYTLNRSTATREIYAQLHPGHA